MKQHLLQKCSLSKVKFRETFLSYALIKLSTLYRFVLAKQYGVQYMTIISKEFFLHFEAFEPKFLYACQEPVPVSNPGYALIPPQHDDHC